MKMIINLLTDFCRESNKDMKNKIVTGYKILDGNVVIELEIIKTDRVGWSGITETIDVDMVELMSFSYQKMLSHNF